MNKKQLRQFVADTLDSARRQGTSFAAPCSSYGECGGCSWQELPYVAQLEAKHERVCREFRDEGLSSPTPERPLASPRVFAYRNRMEFSFSSQRWLTEAEIRSEVRFDRDFALGMHRRGAFDKVVDLDRCWLQSNSANRILETVRNTARESGLPCWNARKHEGFWRFLSLRRAVATEEYMVTLVTSRREPEAMSRIDEAVRSAVSEVRTVMNGVTDRVADTSEGAEYHVVSGEGFITERIGDLSFRLYPNTFFQPNSLAAAQIVASVGRFAGLEGDETVLDLFCGVGVLGLSLAGSCRRMIGAEMVEASVMQARHNATLNGIGNAEFHVHDLLHPPTYDARPDVLVVDPPRAGMHERLVEAIRSWKPKRIVSVGCNPSSQARDLALLTADSRYRVTAIQPIDQFPHTPEIEVVARLERIGDG